jgi:uncharacterized membrane protein YdbT with pleckstrin-like domain
VSFPTKLLNDGEDIVLDLKPHWLFMALSSAVFIVAVVGTMLLAVIWDLGDGFANDLMNYIGGIAFVAALAWVGLTYARWSTTMFVLTTDRIISRHGIIAKHGTDIPLDRVNTVFFRQGILERMVGAGDLVIESASERGNNTFNNVRQPNVVQKEIYTQIEANENRKFDRARQPAAAPAPEPRDLSIPEQIDQLSELHQRGVLSDAEFARKKAELLDRM